MEFLRQDLQISNNTRERQINLNFSDQYYFSLGDVILVLFDMYFRQEEVTITEKNLALVSGRLTETKGNDIQGYP